MAIFLIQTYDANKLKTSTFLEGGFDLPLEGA